MTTESLISLGISLVGCFVVYMSLCVYRVPEGYRGVVRRKGKLDRTHTAGFVFVVFGLEKIHLIKMDSTAKWAKPRPEPIIFELFNAIMNMKPRNRKKGGG